MRWSLDRAFEQVSNLVLQDPIGRETDRIAYVLGFEELVHLGIGEGCVSSEIQTLHDAPVTSNHRLQHRAPAVGAVRVPRSQSTPLDITELVEHE